MASPKDDGDELQSERRLQLVEAHIDRDPDEDIFAAHCAKCQTVLDDEPYDLEAWNPRHRQGWWTLCAPCFELLVATIEAEVEAGPGTPTPEAWTKVRKLRAARRRRWGKADP